MEVGVTTTTTSFSSILDKPLNQLTEEDISQLTREDCRNFLKQKGMRRPSWNKSQAIQQVISLKALFESNEDSGAGALRKILVPPQHVAARVTSNSGDSVKEAIFGEEESQYVQKDVPRSRCETTERGEQLAIFYCGKINVYDGVPLAKARAIMQLAASPVDFTQDNQCNGNAAVRSFLGHVQAAGENNDLVAPTTLNTNCHTMQTEKMTEYQPQFREKGNISRNSDVDGQMNRKVSLQRYLEKRKDRGRIFKGRKNAGQTSSSMEMYLNHQIRTHESNGQSNQSRTSSPLQSGVRHACCSSADNQAKLVNLSVDLNDENLNDESKFRRNPIFANTVSTRGAGI